MADVNANIGVNIDTSEALAQLKALQRQISQFHTSIAKSSESAAMAQRDLQKNFLNSVNAIGAFSAELRTVRTTAESFTDSLEKNKFSMREYFRFAGGSTKTFGKLFKSEFDTIGKVAEDRVKKLQTQYIKLGRDTSGAMKAIAIMPNQLDMSNFSTQSQIAAQKQAIFNQLVKQGSTNLLNFGKNTQWAGRQLMVGFTLPLATLGTVASRTFMEMEQATIKFRKVYGDLFTPDAERQQALEDITTLGQAFTQYGVAVSETVGLAAEAAAAGFAGLDLQRQTKEATRLSILGQVESQKALETTISLQNAFKMSSEDLASSIDFLNAVENQTVVSLDDITTAIPKVAPVIQQLGGDVKDLAFFMAAMKEGGINASEGANALKSGLAALINPTEKASAMLAGYGINIKKIIEGNQGDLKTTVVEFAQALDTLDPLTRARAIEQLFGKFQFARLSTLFSNVINQTGQASRVLDLAGTSIEDLAALSESELGITADSAMNKFRKSIEDLKFALVPVGQVFLEAVTPILEFAGGVLEKFNNMSSGVKKALVILTVAIGAIGPIALMTFGLLANGLANIVKGAMVLRNGYLRLTGQTQILGEQTEYLTMEQIDATAASHSLDQAHARLKQTFTAETAEIVKLIAAYQAATTAGAKFAAINPGMMLPGAVRPTKRAKGKPVVVGGTGNQDTELALLTPGETVIPAEMSQRYGALINGMIAGNIPGYRLGKNASGMFGTSIGKAKEATDLYKAPSAIKPQTIANTWSSFDAEVAAMTSAAEEFLIEAGFSAEQITKKINQLVQKQASHITEQIQQIQVAGETIDVKKWNASNLITDFGGINNYLNSIHKVTETLDEQEISKLASQLNMSIDEFKQELKMLSDGIHPTTRQGGKVLGAIAEKGSASKDTTLAYQSKSVAAGMKVRLAGDFYETIGDRAYDPTKDIKSLEQVNAKVVKLKTQVLDSFNIGDEVASLSGKNAQSLNAAWSQLSMQAKERLIALSGDVNAFTAALMQEAKDAGIAGFEVGKAATTGIARGAKTASPSKDTIKTGQDIGRGLEIGMDSMQDDVAMSGQELGTAAVSGTQNGARQRRRATRPQGPAQQGLVASGVSNTTSRLDSMNRALMGTTFALTTLASAGSMASGPLGDISQQIMKYSGLLFALMSVTQLLTQAKFAEVVATRAKTVADAMGSKTVSGLFSRGGGLAGFVKNILTAGKFLLRFAGPIGLVTTGLIGFYSIIKMINAEREKERQKLEAFSDVITVSTDKLKFLSEQFNFVPVKGSLESFGKDLEKTSVKVRTAREELRASEGFQKTYGENINQVRGMSDQQAQTALSFMGLDLISQGMARDQVQLLIDTIKEEAGKRDLKFDFKSISFDEKGLSGLNSQFDVSIKEFAETAQKGLEKVFVYEAGGTGRDSQTKMVERLIPNAEAKAAIKNAGNLVASYSQSLNRLATSGSMNLEELTKATDTMFESVAKSAPDASMQIRIFNATLNAIDPALSKAVKGVKDLKDMHLLLKSAIAGVSSNLIASAALAFKTAEGLNKVAEANLKALGVKYPTMDFAAQVGFANSRAVDFRLELNKAIKEAIDLSQELNKVEKTTTNTAKNTAEELKKKADELFSFLERAAEREYKPKIINAEKEVKEAQDAVDKIQDKIDAIQADIDIQQRDLETQIVRKIEDYQEQVNDLQRTIELQFDRPIEAIQNEISALERGIELDFSRPLEALQEASSDLSNDLALLDRAVEQINKKYDAQEEALNRVADANQRLIDQDKQKLSLADALTQGDIAAAAAAIQDMRKSSVEAASGSRSEALKAARQAEIDNQRTAAGLTRKQIEEAQFIISQQIFALEEQREAVQARIQIKQDQIFVLEQARKTNLAEIKAIEDKIYLLEEEREARLLVIRAEEDKIYEIKVKQLQPAAKALEDAQKELDRVKALLQARLDNIDLQRDAFEAEEDAALARKVAQGEYNDVLAKTLELLGKIASLNSQITSGAKAYNSKLPIVDTSTKDTPIVDKKVAEQIETLTKLRKQTEPGSALSFKLKEQIDEIKTTGGSLFSRIPIVDEQTKMAGMRASIAAVAPRVTGGGGGGMSSMLMMSSGGMVRPKYFAAGGYSRGTDTIPAMLSPGEFVMSRYAVDSYGVDKMKAINNGAYEGEKVYNYNLSVNVKSDSNPDDIARVVIKQIQQLDNQRIRKQAN